MNKTAKIVLEKGAILPTRGSEEAAGYDLHAFIAEDIEIPPHKVAKISTGLQITPPDGYFGAIFPRSGISTKRGLRLTNCVGVCDYDYTGTYIVPLFNDSDEVQIIHNGDKIAQLVFLPYVGVDFEVVETLDKTERGAGGFGSTGA